LCCALRTARLFSSVTCLWLKNHLLRERRFGRDKVGTLQL
jgi:hypothetical protein